MRDQTATPERMLTFKGGGWLIIASIALSLAIALYMLRGPILSGLGWIEKPPGDNENVETYGFDLSTCLMDSDVFVPGMPHRDFIKPLDDPETVHASVIPDLNKEHPRRKYIVSEDFVIGVSINGEDRAYPISILYVHEIINDEVGGVPIAVTHMFPSDSSVVFDRRVGEETLSFGVSGLVYNSSMLMYDRRPQSSDDDAQDTDDAGADSGGGESLWSQLQARAMTGPAAEAGLTLNVLPSSVVTWGQWKKSHPSTTVIARHSKTSHRRYKYSEPPPSYATSDTLMYPVNPLPDEAAPGDGLALKARIIVVQVGEHRRVYPIEFIASRATPPSSDAADPLDPLETHWTDALGNTLLRFTYHTIFETVSVQGELQTDIKVWYSYWFAWYAMYPEDEVAGADRGG